MKKKKVIYLMLPIIILVWGLVFYQLFSYFFSSPSYAKEDNTVEVNIDEIQVDTFSIVADYRDPFLGKKVKNYKSTVSNTGQRKTAKRNVVKSQPTNLPWPVIEYKGMIKNNNSKKRVGIVYVDGSERLVKEGDVFKEVKVVKIEKQAIKVKFQKEQKIISI